MLTLFYVGVKFIEHKRKLVNNISLHLIILKTRKTAWLMRTPVVNSKN